MSNKLNLELKQGEDFIRLLTFKDENGALIDLTGFIFSGQIRPASNAPLFASFSFDVKDQVTNKGEVEVSLAASITSAKTIGSKLNYVYDIEMNTGSVIERVMQGSILIDPEVTK